MQFQVLVDDEPQPVELVFGGTNELTLLSRWRAPKLVSQVAAVKDTLEFARLASKRWRYYRDTLPFATDAAQFRDIVQSNPQAEVSMLLVLKALWFQHSSLLAFAQCRRTYCHNLVLEFLGAHPRVAGKLDPRIHGTGEGTLCALVELAHHLGIKTVWGEATGGSATFYSRVLEIPIADRFIIEGALMDHCRKKFHDEMMGTT